MGSETQANDVMAAAKKQIENRKKFLKNLSNKEISKVAQIQTLSSEGMAKAKRAEELQATVRKQKIKISKLFLKKFGIF